jgi:hypothetical protein
MFEVWQSRLRVGTSVDPISDIEAAQYLYQRDLVEAFLFWGSFREALLANPKLKTKYASVLLLDNQLNPLLKEFGLVVPPHERPQISFPELDLIAHNILKQDSGRRTWHARISPTLRETHSTAEQLRNTVSQEDIHHYASAVFAFHGNDMIVGKDIVRGKLCRDLPIGLWTVPMAYQDADDLPEVAVGRIIQQELLPNLALSKKLSIPDMREMSLLPKNKPLFQILVYGVLVNVYAVEITTDASSYIKSASDHSRLKDLGFAKVADIKDANEYITRAGLRDIAAISLAIRDNKLQSIEDPNSLYGRFDSTMNERIRGRASKHYRSAFRYY